MTGVSSVIRVFRVSHVTPGSGVFHMFHVFRVSLCDWSLECVSVGGK